MQTGWLEPDDVNVLGRNPAARAVIADSEESRKYLQDAGIDDAEIADTSFFDKHKNDGL